jgi:L-alanine-DL-glutamate epimerase-like enolase superfamily enzyme
MDTIARIDLFSYELTYVNGEYVMSGGRSITSLSSTVAQVTTADGVTGFGETCPLGANYLPAHAAGARAALAEIAPRIVGLDAGNPAAIAAAMDHILLGHGYAKSALDIACWDVFGQITGQPVCELLGGRRNERFPLYIAIPMASPERMREHVELYRRQGVRRFQLKLGGDPALDAERARAVVGVCEDGDVVAGDANGGWRLRDAVIAARLMDGLPHFLLEQPCPTLEECLQVRRRTSLPLILDEVITDLPTLLRAWQARAMEGFNLKLSRVGGLTRAKLLRDVGQGLGLTVNIEDSWGGDLTTAAVSHLAASTSPDALSMVSFMNDWTNEHIAGHEPRSHDGHGAAPTRPGLGTRVELEALGRPFASFQRTGEL